MTSSGPSWHCRHYISLTAVLEFGPTETLPPVGAISKHPGVSADAVAKPSAQTRAESRVLDLRKRLRKRDRLSAGGEWIRTSSSADAVTSVRTLPRGLDARFGMTTCRKSWSSSKAVSK